jgi:undecaprenyl-diphosphatase
MSRLGRHELGVLATLAIVAAAAWGFGALAGEVIEGHTRAFDQAVLLALRDAGDPARPLGGAMAHELARDFTALGSSAILILLTLAVAGYMAMHRKYRAMVLTLAASLGSLALAEGLKLVFMRTRPDLVPHGSYVFTRSFPSSHSMAAAATYLTLGALLARVQPHRRIKAYLLLMAVGLTLLVGISRVYLGVHWPTDVLAGWTGGAAWAMFCWALARWLQKRGEIEPEAAT